MNTRVALALLLMLYPTTSSTYEISNFEEISLQGADVLIGAESVKIKLPAGIIRVRNPIDLNNSSNVFIQGAPNGSSAIYGSKLYQSRQITRNDITPEGMQRDGIQVIDADADIRRLWSIGNETRIGCTATTDISLSENGKRLTCSRWPKNGYSRQATIISSDPKLPRISLPNSLHLTKDAAISISGYFSKDWYFESKNTTPNSLGNIIDIQPLDLPYPLQSDFRYFIQGDPAFLTQPGEFISDPKNSKIYLKPYATDSGGTNLELILTDDLLRIKSANNVVVSGVDFANSRTSAVDIRNSSNVTISRSSVENILGTGIVVKDSTRVAIERSKISMIGGTGVYLSGGSRKTLKPSNNIVNYCDITKTSQINKTYHPAIYLSGVGNTASNNHIYDLPHIAILFEGNDNLIIGNEINNVVKETSDAGAIYSGRDWTYRGNIVTQNFLHEINPLEEYTIDGGYDKKRLMDVKGVYLDDLLSGTDVSRNIFINTFQPIFVGGGRDNNITWNTFINTDSPPVTVDARGLESNSKADPTIVQRKRLFEVPYRSQIYIDRYPRLANILSNSPGAPAGTIVSNNTTIFGGRNKFSNVAMQYVEIFKNYNIEATSNFRFKDVNELGVPNAVIKYISDYDGIISRIIFNTKIRSDRSY